VIICLWWRCCLDGALNDLSPGGGYGASGALSADSAWTDISAYARLCRARGNVSATRAPPVLELLADGEQTYGAVCAVTVSESGIRPAGRLATLAGCCGGGFATVWPDGARRLYAVDADHARSRQWT